MNNAEIIKGLNMTIEGLVILRDTLMSDEESENKTATVQTTATKPTTIKTSSAIETGTDNQATYTMTQLTSMKYNEFKKLAASLGVDCNGKRDEIMSRVIALGVVTDVDGEAPVSNEEDKKPAIGGKGSKPAHVGKGNVKKIDTSTTDEFDSQAEEIAKETPVEAIISALAEVDIKASKLNYKKQLAKALREGLLTLGDDEEEEESEDSSVTEEDIKPESYFVEYDISEGNEPDKMNETRLMLCSERQGVIIDGYKSGKLTVDDISSFIENNAIQEEVDLLGDDYTENDLLKLYIEVVKHYIDDDGAEHEPGEAYLVNEEAYCCGQPLAYDDKTNKFICQHCGQDYEAE